MAWQENYEKLQINNATQKPKVYYARHFYPGVAEYHNERIHIDMPTMKKMCKSMEGCPVYVKHQDVDLENIQNADGFVSDNFINSHDGWMWSKFVAISDDAHEAIKKGWKVSNAYVPLEFSGAGTQHNVDYNRKILNAKFTHLAIVPNPRYEEATIFTPEEYRKYNQGLLRESEQLVNSKPKPKEPNMNIFKMVKTAITGSEAEDEMFVEVAGKTITVAEMKNALEAKATADAEAAAKAAEKTAEETEKKNEKITVAGVEMTVAEAAEKYNALMQGQAAEAAAKAKEIKDAADKAAEKTNDKNFDEVANAAAEAAKKAKTDQPIIETSADLLRRGKELC